VKTSKRDYYTDKKERRAGIARLREERHGLLFRRCLAAMLILGLAAPIGAILLLGSAASVLDYQAVSRDNYPLLITGEVFAILADAAAKIGAFLALLSVILFISEYGLRDKASWGLIAICSLLSPVLSIFAILWTSALIALDASNLTMWLYLGEDLPNIIYNGVVLTLFRWCVDTVLLLGAAVIAMVLGWRYRMNARTLILTAAGFVTLVYMVDTAVTAAAAFSAADVVDGGDVATYIIIPVIAVLACGVGMYFTGMLSAARVTSNNQENMV